MASHPKSRDWQINPKMRPRQGCERSKLWGGQIYINCVWVTRDWILAFSFSSLNRISEIYPLNSIQFSHSVVFDSLRPHELTAACPASLSITNSWSLLRLMSIESMMPSNYFFFCCPLLLLPSILPSIRVFSNESVLHIRWPNYWSFSFTEDKGKTWPGTSLVVQWLGLWGSLLRAKVWSLVKELRSLKLRRTP